MHVHRVCHFCFRSVAERPYLPVAFEHFGQSADTLEIDLLTGFVTRLDHIADVRNRPADAHEHLHDRPVRLVDQHVNAFYARADFALELEGVGQDLPDLQRIGIDPNSTDYELRLFELLQPDDHFTASQLV